MSRSASCPWQKAHLSPRETTSFWQQHLAVSSTGAIQRKPYSVFFHQPPNEDWREGKTSNKRSPLIGLMEGHQAQPCQARVASAKHLSQLKTRLCWSSASWRNSSFVCALYSEKIPQPKLTQGEKIGPFRFFSRNTPMHEGLRALREHRVGHGTLWATPWEWPTALSWKFLS